MKKSNKILSSTKISGKALRQFAENKRIFNKIVEKSVEENKKAGISDKNLYAQ